jgi:hypothetical protein
MARKHFALRFVSDHRCGRILDRSARYRCLIVPGDDRMRRGGTPVLTNEIAACDGLCLALLLLARRH